MLQIDIRLITKGMKEGGREEYDFPIDSSLRKVSIIRIPSPAGGGAEKFKCQGCNSTADVQTI